MLRRVGVFVAYGVILLVGLSWPGVAEAAPSVPSCQAVTVKGDGGYVAFQTDPISKAVAWGAYTWDPSENSGWWHVEWFENSVRRGVHAKDYPPHHSYPPKFAHRGDILSVIGWHHSNRNVWYRVGGECRVT